MELLQFMTVLGFGFVIGLKHAFEADHVIAVSTIVSQTRSLSKSSFFGMMWGLGHTTTLFLFGVLVLLFRTSIPDKVALYFEFLVGAMLVILGLGVLRGIVREKQHIHPHRHGELSHAHIHAHKATAAHTHAHRSFAVGLVHGLAGSAALMLLVLSTVNSIADGLLYILFFGIGSVFGMLFIGAVIGLPFLLTSKFEGIEKCIKMVAGMLSLVLGFAIMYETAVRIIA